MRISDWSSDVCSSDLPRLERRRLRSNGTASLPHGLSVPCYLPGRTKYGNFSAQCRRLSRSSLESNWRFRASLDARRASRSKTRGAGMDGRRCPHLYQSFRSGAGTDQARASELSDDQSDRKSQRLHTSHHYAPRLQFSTTQQQTTHPHTYLL